MPVFLFHIAMQRRVHADDEKAARSLWCQCHDAGFITGVIRDVEA
jgi:hypothetical protein